MSKVSNNDDDDDDNDDGDDDLRVEDDIPVGPVTHVEDQEELVTVLQLDGVDLQDVGHVLPVD